MHLLLTRRDERLQAINSTFIKRRFKVCYKTSQNSHEEVGEITRRLKAECYYGQP
jgi:hypothetical protein